MLKAVIFDMDGVLIDSEKIHAQVETKMFESLGLDISEEEYAGFLGMSMVGLWSKVKDKYGLKEEVGELVKLNTQMFYDFIEGDSMDPIDGVESFIQELLNEDIKIAVATSSREEMMNSMLKLIGLDKYFENRTNADDIDNCKPDPEIYLKAAKKLGVSPGECVAIEDATNGVLAACSAGMKVVGFTGSGDGRQNLDMADLVVGDYKELNLEKLKRLL